MLKAVFAILLLTAVLPVHAASLFEDLGGREKIASFTGDFVDRLDHDARIRKFFAEADMPRLKVKLIDQFCFLTGEPVPYQGADMKKTHAGLGIEESADFNALVEDLQESMDQASIPYDAQNRLIALLAPLERDVVTK